MIRRTPAMEALQLRRRTRGFTLLETMIFVSLLLSILSLGAICFVEVIRLRGAQERYQQRMDTADYLLRRVAKDVRAARAFRDSAAEFRSDRSTLILDSGPATVIYRAGRKGVERIELATGARQTALVTQTPRLQVSFDLEAVTPASARWAATTIAWDEPPLIGVSHPMLSLRTALRNRP
jgi:type II secretory pathway component PulJ